MSSCFCPSPRSRLFISSSPSLSPFPPIFVDIYSHFSSPILRAPLSSRASSPTASTPLLRTTYCDCPPLRTRPNVADAGLYLHLLTAHWGAHKYDPRRRPHSWYALRLCTISHTAFLSSPPPSSIFAPSPDEQGKRHKQRSLLQHHRAIALLLANLLYKRSCWAFSKSISLRRTPTKVLHRAATYTTLSRPRRIAFRLCGLALTIARQHHPLPPVRAHKRPTSPTSPLTCRAACPYSIAPSRSTRRLCPAYNPHRVLNQRRISLAAFASLALSRLRRNRVSVTAASTYSTLPSSARPEFRL